MAFNYDDPDLGLDDEDEDESPDYDYEDYDFDDFDDDEDNEDEDTDEDDAEFEDDEEDDEEDDYQDDYEDDTDLDDLNNQNNTSSGEDGEKFDNISSKNTTSSAGSTTTGANGVGSAGAGASGTGVAGATSGATAGGVATAGTTGGAVAGGVATAGTTGGTVAGGVATAGGTTAGLAICWPIVIAVLVIFLILIISASITVATENADEENGTITYQTITDENFYGVRTVYIDHTELATQLQNSYKDYCLDIFNILKENSAISLTLNTDDPSNLDSSTSLALNNLSIGIGNIIATGNSDFNEIEFASLYNNIQYFGISNDKLPTVNEFICNYLISNNLATSTSSQSIEELINTALQDTRLEYIKNQCEKVMIKDIVAGENGFGTIKSNLKGIIYLPKKQVTLSNLQYNIRVNDDADTVNMKIISNNGSTSTTLQEENIDISWNENLCFSEFDEDLELSVGQYGNVGSNENPLYLESVSLFTLLKNSSNLAQKDGIYTWTPTEKCIYLIFESTNSFTINEFYISVE